MQNRKSIIMYICDGNMCGSKAMYCKYRHKNWLCAHTTDKNHAANGECKDPWNHPERFVREYDKQTHTTCWVERYKEFFSKKKAKEE